MNDDDVNFQSHSLASVLPNAMLSPWAVPSKWVNH